MNEIVQQIMPYVISILGVILGAVALRIGKAVDRTMDKYNIYDAIKSNQVIVKASVEYVEQVFKELGGEEKFQLAKEKALKMFEERGITIGEEELNALIEQTVFNFNKGVATVSEIEYPFISLEDSSEFIEEMSLHTDNLIISSNEEEVKSNEQRPFK